MADVFVSYKREDALRVRKLVEALRAAELDVWWDDDIPASAPWEATIERALAEARTVLVCWSPDAVTSENVRSEARVAREDGRLIQLFLRPCQPPLFFGERQGIDLTKWRGGTNDPRIAKVVDAVRKTKAGERLDGAEHARRTRRTDMRIAAATAAFLVVAASLAAWLLLAPASKTGPTTLAVLPFRAQSPADTSLVDGIWDDTRGALGHNPNLRVIGRESMEALSGKALQPDDYRRMTGADYLLGGSVEHVGDQVQMKLNLTRTRDGVEVWSDRIGGKLDDVFALQARIAEEVEGRIRGRVAPGGGKVAANIATSAEVYAIYAQARTKLRARGPSAREAIPLLKRAVAMDSNYAPAWADLAEATKLRGVGSAEQVRSEASAYVKRALTLAPNLGHAHAVWALVQDVSPQTEGELRRAVALDPGDKEAWMWLGNCLLQQNRVKDALDAHSRAVEIEPLWFNSMYNKMDDLARLDDRRGLSRELRRVEGLGDPYLTLRAREHVAWLTGQIAEAARDELEIRRRFPDQTGRFDIAEILLSLGYLDEFAAILGISRSEMAPYRGEPLSSEQLRKRYPDPRDFWQDSDTALVYARLLPKHGRLAEYAGLYKAAFKNADDYYGAVAWASWGQFADQAPNVAANLRAAGETALAQEINDKEEAILAPLLRNGPANWQMGWRLAELRASEGRYDEAVALLRRAIGQGWLPDGATFAIDMAEEPCFAPLLNRPDFQAIRNHVLSHLEEQRRQITPAMLAAASIPRAAAA